MIQAEGLEMLNEFVEFEDDSNRTPCNSVRRPGVMILNPQHTVHEALNTAAPDGAAQIHLNLIIILLKY